MTGKKDISKLTPRKITDKRGVVRTVYVKPEGTKVIETTRRTPMGGIVRETKYEGTPPKPEKEWEEIKRIDKELRKYIDEHWDEIIEKIREIRKRGEKQARKQGIKIELPIPYDM